MLCFNRGGAHSLSTRERNLSKLTKLSINSTSRRFDGRTPDSPAPVANQVNTTYLSFFFYLFFVLLNFVSLLVLISIVNLL